MSTDLPLRAWALATLVAAAGVAGCRKDSTPSEPVVVPQVAPAPSAKAPTPVTPGTVTSEAPPPAVPTTLPMTAPGAGESFPQSVNSALTGAVARFHDKHRRFPRDWNELVAEGFIATLPKAAAGKRFAIDPDTRIVVEVSR